jgi:tyrosine-protein kinase Etk/Wzc
LKESQEQYQEHQEQEIHLSDYIDILLRRRKIFVTAFLGVFVAIALYTFLMQPVYRASSTVYVKEENAKLSGLNQLLMPGGDNSIQAEIEIIKSRTIAEKVVRKLNLDWNIERSSKASSCKIEDISVAHAINELKLTKTGSAEFKVEDVQGRKLGEGVNGQPFRKSGLMFVVQLSGKSGDSFTLNRVPISGAVAALKDATTVKELGRMTNVVEISYENNRPDMARDVVNALVQAYLDQSLAFKTQEAGKTVSFIEEQMNGIKEELNKAEVNLQEYKSSAGVVQLDAEAQELIRKYSALEQQKVGINLNKKQLEFALAAQHDALAEGQPYSPAIMKDDPLVAEMARQLAGLEVQKRGLLVEYTPNHPAVQNVQVQIDEIQQKIRNTYQTGINNLASQESDVSQKLGTYEGELKNIPVEELDLARYTRLAKVTSDIYTFLLQKHEEARIAKASTISNINVIDPAVLPLLPVKPEKAKYLLIGLILSVVGGLGSSLVMEYFDDSVKNESDAKRVLGYTHLATIPYLSLGVAGKQGSESNVLITDKDQRSVAAEAFRSLRTALHFSTPDDRRQVLLMTSSFPGEGKSTVSSNLAVTIAQTGARTLLIDNDLHKSKLHERMGVQKVPGVADVLAGDIDLSDAFQKTSVENLTILTAGTTSPNPSVLLSSGAMKELVERLRRSFDRIVIDAPPTLPVADSIQLTSLADQVVIVLESGRVPAKAAERLRELLATAKAPVAGFVFNNKEVQQASGYSYGYGYGEGYGYGYGQDDDKRRKKGKTQNPMQKLLTALKAKSHFKS